MGRPDLRRAAERRPVVPAQRRHLHRLRKEKGVEQIIPFDPIPRLIAADEWADRAGLEQRVRALNLFIHDVYHDRLILRGPDGPPRARPGGLGLPARVRRPAGPEGHLHPHLGDRPDPRRRRDVPGPGGQRPDPSGVSYVLKNRQVMKQVFPASSSRTTSAPSTTTPRTCWPCSTTSPPAGCDDPTVVVLTPGVYNSAYYEHSYLARQMGVELVEGRDLFLDASQVFMRTIRGPKRVDVLYRRVDDDFLDPLTFRRDSQLGVTGLVGAYRAGSLGLANAHRHRRRRRQGDLSVRPRDHPLLPERGPDPAQRQDLPPAIRPSASTSWRTWTSWWSRPSTARGATGC